MALTLVLFAVGLTVVADSPAGAATVNITVGPGSGSGYNPNGRSDTINAGQSVGWTWASGSPQHSVTFSDGPDSGLRSSGATYGRTFSSAGTYNYHCVLHANMTGTVVVKSTATTPPPTTSPPTTSKPPPTSPPPTSGSGGGGSATTAKGTTGGTAAGGSGSGTTGSTAATSGGGASTTGNTAAGSGGGVTGDTAAKGLAAANAGAKKTGSNTGLWVMAILTLVVGGGLGLWYALRRRPT